MLQSQFVTLAEESEGWNRTVPQLIHAFNILLCVVCTYGDEAADGDQILSCSDNVPSGLINALKKGPLRWIEAASILKKEDAWSKHKPAAVFPTQRVSEHQGQTNSLPSLFHCKHQYCGYHYRPGLRASALRDWGVAEAWRWSETPGWRPAVSGGSGSRRGPSASAPSAG